MPIFRQVITGSMTVTVEAKDMYEADAKIADMSGTELEAAGSNVEWYNYDTSEFPEEVG